MAQLTCVCGYIIRDQTDALSSKGRFIPDEDDEESFTETTKRIAEFIRAKELGRREAFLRNIWTGSEIKMNTQKAAKNSWKTKPMPEEFRVQLQVTKTFSHEEYRLLQLGRIPRTMEDKWFIYLDGDWLFFQRSWTGDCIYQLRLEQNNAQYSIA